MSATGLSGGVSGGAAPRGLFVNCQRAQCSIYESGEMFYETIRHSDRYTLDHAEVRRFEEVPGGYDFYAFNYHFLTMARFDTWRVATLPGVKLTFVLEVLPNDPFVLCPDHFDAYCVADPTCEIADPRVFAFPRPLDTVTGLPQPLDIGHPVIGTFGFATPGKGFDEVVRAVSREFDRATVRLHIPAASHADLNAEKAARLVEECRRQAGPGIHVEPTHDYKGKRELIDWCAENTINLFFYDRHLPGLAATCDQAVMSGRPLLVSRCETFRHVHRYIRPYPDQSIRDAILHTPGDVARMQEDWSRERFAGRFVEVLEATGVLESARPAPARPAVVVPQPPPATPGKVLFVSHAAERCGIHQYGRTIHEAIATSKRYDIEYAELGSAAEFLRLAGRLRPEAVIYNYHHITLPWVTSTLIHGVPGTHLGILHEFRPRFLDGECRDLFDRVIVGDPTVHTDNPVVSTVGRIVAPFRGGVPAPNGVVIGSFGFGFRDKGFARLARQVNEEFEEATLRLHVTYSHYCDPDGEIARACIDECRQALTKPGIRLEVAHDFVSRDELLAFLAGNSLNAFLYDADKDYGISSVPDLALAVGRPMVVSASPMFRHVHGVTPSIRIEDRGLREILASGFEPLRPLAEAWTPAAMCARFEEILDAELRVPRGAVTSAALSLQGQP